MDSGKSALVNITNGGGKTSLVEILLFLLSRDSRLLKKIREKVAPKGRGFTHARIEFRAPPEDNYSAPSLLEIDTVNLPGETHVVGVILNDDINDPPILYSYSGTLEDSPCYIFDGKSLTSVQDAEFIARTKSLRGCKWNKFNSRREWEDHIRLFLPVEVIRRNVIYQLKGSDDKNASFFDFTPKGGESYDSAFFRSVIAPDLLNNLLSTFTDEDETAVEDTLLKSLSRIVDADREIARKEQHLAIRESGIAKLEPMLAVGTTAENLKRQRDITLRDLRKDVVFLWHFGLQGESTTIPGLPRKLPKMGDQDPRILVALKGMVITRDEGILLLDKTLSELSRVEVRVISQAADRKQIPSFPTKTQVIDFACDFGFSTSGIAGGGHYRKGYSKDSALAIPGIIGGISGAKTEGLTEVLAMAFDIAEAQIDTNPGSHAVRRFEAQCLTLTKEAKGAEEQIEILKIAIAGLETQIKDRQDNQGAWDDFIKVGNLLPNEQRAEPAQAKLWIDKELSSIKQEIVKRSERLGELREAWSNYLAVMERHGLQGIDGVRERHIELVIQRDRIKAERTNIDRALDAANAALRAAQDSIGPLVKKAAEAVKLLEELSKLKEGFKQFQTIFGNIDPKVVNPLEDHRLAINALAKIRLAVKRNTDEANDLRSLRSQASTFKAIFGESADPLKCDPLHDQRIWTEHESVARQSMAALNDKKEAIEQFEDIHPGTTPSAWIAAADQTRSELLDAKSMHESRSHDLKKEIKAIKEMGSVEDGAFEKAWAVLIAGRSKAQRLHETVLSAGYSLELRTDVMSAFSGMLSAPVFDTLQEMQTAANTLHAANASVPLILKSALLQDIQNGISRHGDIRLFGFIGGNFSRRVRILLEPEYARTELDRLNEDLSLCEIELKRISARLPLFMTTSIDYQLASKAADALAAGAREKYLNYEAQAKAAGDELVKIRPRVTSQALDVLSSAKSFIAKDGTARLTELEAELPSLKTEVLTQESAEELAKTRASQESLNARDAASKYLGMGGDIAHQDTANAVYENNEELELGKAKAHETAELVDGLVEQRKVIEAEAEEFELNRGLAEIDHLSRALNLADDENDLKFMTNFKKVEHEFSSKETSLTNALSVNYTRAESFKLNQDKNDLDLNLEIAKNKQQSLNLQNLVNQNNTTVSRLKGAEIPTWSRLGKAIHDLAYEIGHRVAQTDKVVEQALELEEGQAIPEAHPAYPQTEALLRALHKPDLDASGKLIEQIDEVTQLIQEIAINDGLSNHKRIDVAYTTALVSYTKLNSAFCEEAEKTAGSSDAAFNTLEIEEIRKATPSAMRVLTELFGRLQDSLIKDRDEAQRAKRVAEETNEDTISQLSRLISSAEDNLKILNRVMQRYPGGRFFIETQINKDEEIKDIIEDLKLEVERANRDADTHSKSLRRNNDTQIKRVLRDKLIECVFTNTEVEFVNAGIWSGKQRPVSEKLSTGQKIALEFMWIVRQAEYEIERSLTELSSKQAAKSRAKANRVILIDGIFSTLSDRKIIKEALNGLRGLGGNFQIIGFLHSPTWTNDFTVFPVYHVGKKLTNSAGDGLVSFREAGREMGTVGFFSTITQSSAQVMSA
jgi:hypothetical protein